MISENKEEAKSGFIDGDGCLWHTVSVEVAIYEQALFHRCSGGWLLFVWLVAGGTEDACQNFEVKNINLDPPDPKMFEVPSGYRLVKMDEQ